MVPGFTTSMRTRPLVISKMVSYLHEKSVTLGSFKRLLEELKNICMEKWKGTSKFIRYNDDLTMAFGIGCF